MSSELTLQMCIFPDGAKSFHGRRRKMRLQAFAQPYVHTLLNTNTLSFTLTQRPEAKEIIVPILQRTTLGVLPPARGLYLGVFLAAVSGAFITQINNVLVTAIASGLTIIAIIIIMTYLVRQVKIIPKTNS